MLTSFLWFTHFWKWVGFLDGKDVFTIYIRYHNIPFKYHIIVFVNYTSKSRKISWFFSIFQRWPVVWYYSELITFNDVQIVSSLAVETSINWLAYVFNPPSVWNPFSLISSNVRLFPNIKLAVSKHEYMLSLRMGGKDIGIPEAARIIGATEWTWPFVMTT